MSTELFRLNATLDTPLILVQTELPEVIIKGISMPENSFEFYDPIEKSVMEHLQGKGSEVTMEIELNYLNSMSGKQLLQLIRKVKSAHDGLNVWWKYKAEDDLIRIKGEDIKRICPQIKIELFALATH